MFSPVALRIVSDSRDLTAPYVLQHHAFEQIVYVVCAKLQFHTPVAIDFAIVLEVTDAGVETRDDSCDRKFRNRKVGSQEVA